MDLKQELLRQSRRHFFGRCGAGLGAMALSTLLYEDGLLAAETPPSEHPFAPKLPHSAPKAKAVIYLFMAGGPSHLDLFDYKPKLQQLDAQSIPKSYVEGKRFAVISQDSRLLGTKRKFRKYGDSAAQLSELLPNTASIADDIAIIRTMVSEEFIHIPATLLFTTGYRRIGFPSMGSWITYGIGSESRDLPGFVVLHSGPPGPIGAGHWSSGFLSSAYEGVPLRSSGDPILYLKRPDAVSGDSQKRTLDAICKLNAAHLESTRDDEIQTQIANYEMAYRMHSSAPELIDIARETPATLKMYGAEPGKSSFANNCLLARRLVERGARFVMLFHSNWDHHVNLETGLNRLCGQTDQASAALVKDLKQHGLLDQTLVIWGGEFGRTPMRQNLDMRQRGIGRDHHPYTFSMWLAGGGVKAGQTMGQTDELGFYPVEEDDRVHVHDLQATILHLLGLDHLKLTYRFRGRDFRLTDVGGKVVQRLLA